jgi:glycosyltransferase involved in cell wall biosynthesis
MKILIISFYYEPDLCAGSFRTTSFVKALKPLLKENDSIDVVTTMPNRYSTFAIEANEVETQNNLLIKRIKIPLHKSGFFDQSKSFLVYMIKTLKYVQGKKYDIVFATSSRLLSAFLGAVISKQKKIPLYLDLRDIFTDTLLSVLKESKLRSVVPLFTMIEKFTMRSADNINFVSKGFISYFQERYGHGLRYSFYPNGIDEEFLNFNCNPSGMKNKSSKIVFTYTGNIGEGQGLEKIVPQIAQKYPNIEFYIIGDGGRKKVLQECTAHIENVKLIDPVNRMDLIKYYEDSDFLFLQLDDYDAFKKVLPSKIFEYAATYKPIIAGVDGYAKDFIEEHLPDSLIYKPCDIVDFCEKFASFDATVNIDNRRKFINKFSRKSIMDEMSQDFLQVLKR